MEQIENEMKNDNFSKEYKTSNYNKMIVETEKFKRNEEEKSGHINIVRRHKNVEKWLTEDLCLATVDCITAESVLMTSQMLALLKDVPDLKRQYIFFFSEIFPIKLS